MLEETFNLQGFSRSLKNGTIFSSDASILDLFLCVFLFSLKKYLMVKFLCSPHAHLPWTKVCLFVILPVLLQKQNSFPSMDGNSAPRTDNFADVGLFCYAHTARN